MSNGTGVEDDPRDYVASLVDLFVAMKPKMKPTGIFWLNVGDAYNTPVNWSGEDRKYSSLGADKAGLSEHNSAYVKPRHKRKAFTKKDVPWLTYGNLLALPYRIVEGLCDEGFLYRGEVIWNKSNPMPEGRCRRPHRQHESIYLLAVDERHEFRVSNGHCSPYERLFIHRLRNRSRSSAGSARTHGRNSCFGFKGRELNEMNPKH